MQHEMIEMIEDVEEIGNFDSLEDLGLTKKRRTSKFRGKNSGRVCRNCGKDPYPNYFYCPPCHHRVSHLGMDEEHEDHHAH